MFDTVLSATSSSHIQQGDNAVLAQKVAKELSAAVEKGDYKLVKVDLKASKAFKMDSLDDCVALIQMREALVVNLVRERHPT